MKNYIILFLLPIILPAQELSILEFYGDCKILRGDSTIQVTNQSIINYDDQISILRDSYLVLASNKNQTVEIPLSTGNYFAKDICSISETNNSSILTFFKNVYAHFTNKDPNKSYIVSGAVTRSECIFTIVKNEFYFNNDCKKGVVQILDINQDTVVHEFQFSKKNKIIPLPFKLLLPGNYSIDIAINNKVTSYLVRKEENNQTQIEVSKLNSIYSEENLQLFYNQNCIWPDHLDLKTELDE